MDAILTILWLLSIICLIVGLIVPSAFTFLFKSQTSRKMVGITFSLTSFALLVLIGISAPKKSTETEVKNSSTVTKAAMSKPTKVLIPTVKPTSATPIITSSPTPTPADWVANPLCNLDNFDECLREKYPLEAAVKADSFALYITNKQNVEWTDCHVDFDDNSYGMNLYDYFTVEAGSTTSVPWGKLIDDKGNRFDDTKIQPGPVDVSCTVNHEQHSSQYSGF